MRLKLFAITLVLSLFLTSCTTAGDKSRENVTTISLSDEKITVDRKAVGTDNTNAVYTANDIIYYEDGKDFTYGEGSEKDAHSKEEAKKHTVVHITHAGTYSLSGKLSYGQIAVDLGEDAKKDPNAIVTLILDSADVNCSVAPAVIFYNVYECGNSDADSATKDVDTQNAGARIIIADDSTNNISGSYVERIYKPDSVVLNDEKTEVEDAKKLHKYDGAFYSKMSMTINGEKKGSGILNITAQNEGLDSEMHLTLNGGNVNIISGNDGINTNEDGVSVTTINGGNLKIKVSGETGEGDGIDSNGWLVINGGSVTAMACSDSADAGIDSDMGIYINGGEVIASGSMLDKIESGGQTYAVFNFPQKQKSGTALKLKDKDETSVLDFTPENSFSVLIFSSPHFSSGSYTLYSGENQLLAGAGSAFSPGMHFQKPDGEVQNPQGQEPPTGSRPERPSDILGGEPPQKPDMPNDNVSRPQINPDMQRPEGDFPMTPPNQNGEQTNTEPSSEFKINDGANMFNVTSN